MGQKEDDLFINQKALQMDNVKGINIQGAPEEGLVLGRTFISQEAGLMNNTIGMNLNLSNSDGSVFINDKVEINQNSNGFRSRVVFNGHLPGVKIVFNKKD